MEKYRAIPKGYMTIGELARKMNVTVRTLQYYDNENILKPSSESDGGRRLYTDKDVFKLHQIQSMKYIGFSLDDIKNRLAMLKTPNEVGNVLDEQASVIQGKITSLLEELKIIEKLKAETLQMETVDFKKYADIILLLQADSNNYWAVKYLDDKLLEHLRNHFDEESGKEMLTRWKSLCDNTNLQCGDEEEWWALVMRFTGGDLGLLPGFDKYIEEKNCDDRCWNEMKELVNAYIMKIMEVYLQILNLIRLKGEGDV